MMDDGFIVQGPIVVLELLVWSFPEGSAVGITGGVSLKVYPAAQKRGVLILYDFYFTFDVIETDFFQGHIGL